MRDARASERTTMDDDTIVVDNGAFKVKSGDNCLYLRYFAHFLGYLGEQAPRASFFNVVGRPKGTLHSSTHTYV